MIRNKTYNVFYDDKLNIMAKYLLIFFSIVLSRDTLVTSLKFGFNKASIIYGIFILLITALVVFNNKSTIEFDKDKTIKFAIFIVAMLVSSLIKLDFQAYILSIIFYIIVAYLFTYIFTFEEYFEITSNITVVLALLSLVGCYLMKPILFRHGVANPYIAKVVNSAGLEFFDLGFSYVVALKYYVRNFGIFREPGVYQFFLLLPLIYEILVNRKKERKIKIVILVITMFSTFSMTGIVSMGMIFIARIIDMAFNNEFTKEKKKIVVVVLGVFIVIGLALYMINPNFNSIVNETMKKVFTKNDSTSARAGSIINNIKLFISSPIWGNKFSKVHMALYDNTNSTFSIFAIFGIVSGILSIMYQWIFARIISKHIISRLFVLGALMLAINTQFLLGNSIFWILLFSIYMNRDNIGIY